MTKVEEFIVKLDRDRMISYVASKYTRGDLSKAEDIMHSAIAVALEKQCLFVYGDNVRAWFMTILFRTFINEYRHESKKNEGYQKMIPNVVDRFKVNYADKMLLENVCASNYENLDMLMKWASGWQYREIAEESGLSLSNVKTSIWRVRKQLKKEFGEYINY